MQTEHLFSQALGIVSPWKISSVSFNTEEKCLDIHVDFERGSTFSYKNDSMLDEKNTKPTIRLKRPGVI